MTMTQVAELYPWGLEDMNVLKQVVFPFFLHDVPSLLKHLVGGIRSPVEGCLIAGDERTAFLGLEASYR